MRPPKGFSSRRSLLVSALSNYHQSLCKGSTATQRAPVARTQPTLPPSSLISLTFTATRQALCFFPCTPRATALRQARVSGGNLQNCAPSAACGGAMTQESTVPPRSSYPSPKNEPPPSCDDGGVLLAIIPGFRRAARPRDILPRGCPRRNRRPCPPGLRGCSG